MQNYLQLCYVLPYNAKNNKSRNIKEPGKQPKQFIALVKLHGIK